MFKRGFYVATTGDLNLAFDNEAVLAARPQWASPDGGNAEPSI
jgi:hypothetical protein